jgi:inosose dehydratase
VPANRRDHTQRDLWTTSATEANVTHIHWKDLPADWEAKRGTMYGCGFGPIALGEGVIDIKGVFEVLNDSPHVQYSTLEVGGDANVLKSYEFLKSLGAE